MFVGFSSNDDLILYPMQSYSGLLCSSCAAGAPTRSYLVLPVESLEKAHLWAA